MERDYLNNFDMDGDLLDQVIMNDFDIKPKYVGYQVIRDIIGLVLEHESMSMNDAVEAYALSLNKEPNEVLVTIAVCFKYSRKKLVKTGATIYILTILFNRYKALLNQEKQK